jgi:hypothetical protein
MSTYTPVELLSLWKLEQLSLEMATGHLLQHLVKLTSELEAQRTVVTNLRTEVDRLLAHSQLPPNARNKPKSAKSGEVPDSGA